MYGHERRVAPVVTVLFTLLLSSGADAATITFQPPVSYSVGANPASVSFGDFNGDGKSDLAIVSMGFADTGDEGGVSVLLGNGDGTFQAARNFAAGKQPESIAIADFNSDDRLDIIAVSEFGNVLNVLLGNGDGTFQPPFTVTLSDIDPYFVIAGDFNNDHKWDVAVSGLGRDLDGDGIRDSAGGTAVLLGNGDGTFQTHGPLMPQVLSVAADFNQDNRLDLAVTMFPGFDLFLGTGDGSFQAPSSNTVEGRVGNAVDFNGDGKLDLVAFLPLHPCGLQACDGQISVLLGNGDGTFSSTFSQTGPYLTLTVGDFDADGNPDLAVIDNNADHTSHILRGDGKGKFVDTGTFVVSNSSSFAHLTAADLNGDNLADLVTTGDDNTIAVQLNTTPADFLFDMSPTSVPPVRAGGSATLTLTAVPQAGFGANITLSCSSPTAQGINCSLSPSSVAPRSSATLTVTTTGPSAALAPGSGATRILFASGLPIFGLVLAGFSVANPQRRRTRLASLLLSFCLLAGVLWQAACGGKSDNHGPQGTPAGTYTVTITGTSGSTQHSTTVTLTVR